MTIMKQHDFSHTYTELTTLLATEESASPITNVADLEVCYQRRHVLTEQLGALEQTLHDVQRRIDHLPWLPDVEQVRWAQALLAFPNLAFLEVDTDGLYDDADILRLVLVDTSGTPLYAQFFQPRRPIDAHITHLTAITPEMLELAPRLAEEWERITNVFAGRYVLSFNLEFDQAKLRENALHYEVAPLTTIGACLMQASQTYFRRYRYPKLATLCEQIGFPLPDHPSQDAFDRVHGQIHLLEAMAQGITTLPSAERATPPGSISQDDDPFAPDA